jgi:hypothetical protein
VNLTVTDLLGISVTTIVWFVVSTTQGIVIGQLTNVFNFRSRSILRQVSLAAVLSMGVVPSLYNLVVLAGGLTTAAILNVVFVLAFIAIVALRRHRFNRLRQYFLLDLNAHRYLLIAVCVWLAVGGIALVDFQIGDRLYLSLTMHDHSHKTAIVDWILHNRLPPDNPGFHPAHPVAFPYHYYWALICAVISRTFGSASDTRLVVLSGVIWTGVVLLASIEFCSAYFKRVAAPMRQVQLVTTALLLVTNLYVLVDLPMNLAIQPLPVIDICWWSRDGMSTFIHSLIWLPHNVTSLAAGILASVLLIEVKPDWAWKRKLIYLILAGFCLASAFGMCAFVGFAFGITWLVWAIMRFWQREYSDAIATFGAAMISLALTVPFLAQLARFFLERTGIHTHTFPLTLGNRSFELIYLLPNLVPPKGTFAYETLLFLMLPFNYIFGLGYILMATCAYWRDKIVAHSRLHREQLFLIAMIGTSLLLSSFVRRTRDFNEFGWRTLILAQFGMLICSGQFLAGQLNKLGLKRLSRSTWFFLVVGFATTIYTVVLDRTAFAELFDPKRSYDIRELYTTLDRQLPANAVIQHNPTLPGRFPVEMFALLYSHRQVVCTEIADLSIGPELPDVAEYRAVCENVASLFNHAQLTDAINICRRYKINVLVVKDTDKVWSDRSAWVWKFPIIAENAHVRAFLIRDFSLNR